jgi:hypothetical protein
MCFIKFVFCLNINIGNRLIRTAVSSYMPFAVRWKPSSYSRRTLWIVLNGLDFSYFILTCSYSYFIHLFNFHLVIIVFPARH